MSDEKREPVYASPHQEGISLRDYFAAKALTAWVTANGANTGQCPSSEAFAEWAYETADAMLKAREVPR